MSQSKGSDSTVGHSYHRLTVKEARDETELQPIAAIVSKHATGRARE